MGAIEYLPTGKYLKLVGTSPAIVSFSILTVCLHRKIRKPRRWWQDWINIVLASQLLQGIIIFLFISKCLLRWKSSLSRSRCSAFRLYYTSTTHGTNVTLARFARFSGSSSGDFFSFADAFANAFAGTRADA